MFTQQVMAHTDMHDDHHDHSMVLAFCFVEIKL